MSRMRALQRLGDRQLRRRASARMAMATLALAAVACAPAGPRELRLGEEACGYCRMTIDDARFAAQARTSRGRTETFDSIECLADWAAAAPAGSVAALWVSDFRSPGAWIPADEARFVRLTRTSSPMGRGLAAVRASASEADRAAIGAEGPAATWAELLKDAAARRAGPRADTSHAH